jgi:uncharacterized repeat protein (TIGR03803 family)
MGPIAIALAAVVLALPAQAQTYTVLYNFAGTGGDGGGPIGRLIQDSAGNLYGTTTGGGAFGFGTVFKLDAHGAETVLYSFAGTASGDGDSPYSGLTLDHLGNFYGTTFKGGVDDLGTVYKIDTTTYQETIVHSFAATEGANPATGVVQDKAGNLYGTTYKGGFYGYGAVYKLAADGTVTVLYSFPTAEIPFYPSGLVRDAQGNLYGTTQYGDGTQDSGTVFKVDVSGAETTLYSFTALDGEHPVATLIRDVFGNLYGTTYLGGSFARGTVFKLDAAGTETVLYNFTGKRDGGYPYAGVIRDAAGNLYGTTTQGALNFGTVFKISPAGRATVLHSFTGADGNTPFTTLIQDAGGSLYGAAAGGGTFDVGVIFKITP